MSLDEVSEEDKAALHKEWETQRRLESLEAEQQKQRMELKEFKAEVSPVLILVKEVHTAVVGLQGKSSKGWAKFDKGTARIAVILGLISMIGLGGWRIYDWVDSVNKAAAVVKAAPSVGGKP